MQFNEFQPNFDTLTYLFSKTNDEELQTEYFFVMELFEDEYTYVYPNIESLIDLSKDVVAKMTQ